MQLEQEDVAGLARESDGRRVQRGHVPDWVELEIGNFDTLALLMLLRDIDQDDLTTLQADCKLAPADPGH